MEVEYERSNQLVSIQKAGIHLLRIFDGICKSNGLVYFLSYGTLLGAVRHKGFIPWDDDIDIVMPREDFERLGKLTKMEIGNKAIIQNHNTETEYWLPFSKIRLLGTEIIDKRPGFKHRNNVKERGIWLDIFPIDRCECLPSGRPARFDKIKDYILTMLQCSSLYYAMHGNKRLERLFRFRKRCLLWLITMFFSRLGLSTKRTQKRILNAFDRIATFRSKGDCYVTRGVDSAIEKRIVPAAWYFPAKEAIFEGSSFNIPNNADGILRILYGNDYMTPPPKEKRERHFDDEAIVNIPSDILN